MMNTNSVISSDTAEGWVAKLPTLLRGFGAAAVLFSLYSFLFRGWEGNSDVVRYLMLLGHTGALAVIALASGRILKEGKGPRLLLLLALVSVVVSSSILGAFLLSASGAAVAVYPTYVTWVMSSFPHALLLTAASSLLLIPVSLIAFRALARGMSRSMSTLFLLANACLLLPLRDPTLVTVMACALAFYTLFISAKTLRQRTEVKTREGMLVLLLQFLPVAVLLGRNIWLYAFDATLLLALSLVAFTAVRQCGRLLDRESRLQLPLELSSSVLALLAAGCVCQLLDLANSDGSTMIMLSALTASGLLYELSMRARNLAGLYRVLATLLMAMASVIALLFFGGMLSSLSITVLGLALITASYFSQQRSLLMLGSLMTAAGFIGQLVHMMQWFDFGYWVGLALIGTLAIVGGSLLETRGEQFKQRVRDYRDSLQAWSA